MGREVAALLLLLALLPAAAHGQQVWRQVDDQGAVRYADRPFGAAAEFRLSEPGRWSSQSRLSRSAPPADRRDHPAIARPPGVAIARPAPEETVWGVGGELEVTLAMDAPLEPGQRVVLELDGAEAAWQGELPAVRLTQVWRGEHRLRAWLLDAGGTEVAASGEVRFYKRQPSVTRAAGGSP